MRELMARAAVVGSWLVVVVLLALLLVGTVHRGHLANILIVATGLAGMVVVPLMMWRFRRVNA
ncbi:MAG TPA: hypothetical protein VFJ17_00885 [Mycobacteriales bacterium]|jgi:hypothetical protein|nr:hypothetical protein [Mycobacteriales bacterium]